MARLVFLGTSGAVPTLARDTTSLAFDAGDHAVLVDVGGSPVARLRAGGVDPFALTHVVVTHLHADHAYGLPALVQGLVLLGRRAPLTVVCRPEHAAALRDLCRLFGVWAREEVPVTLQPIDLAVGARAFATGPLEVRTAPNAHGTMPNFAVRVDAAGRGIVYSSDTTPSDAVVALARGADTLVHEATFPDRDRGRFGAHSTAGEAGAIAARAGVRRLILVHIEADYHDATDALAAEAAAHFGGAIEVARDLAAYPF